MEFPKKREKEVSVQTKKSKYKQHVRECVLAGMVNDPSGSWRSEKETFITNKCFKFQLCGTAGRSSMERAAAHL